MMPALLVPTLAWRPFLDPLDLHDWWYFLLIPLALGISVAYKAVRVGDKGDYARSVVVMTIQIIVAMILLAAAAHVLFVILAPRLVPMG
jgi:hypothetical protein